MTNPTNSYKTILQLIADIISFKPNETELRLQLQHIKTDWEGLVKVASAHLVLTTLYCRLKQKNLLDGLPEDLHIYLKELTAINRNRNLTLFEEIKDISNVLNANNINHVFLKGCALLAGNYYEDPSERMIGDIDILVASDQIQKAFQLMTSQGYSKYITFNYTVNNFRHLDRQVHEDKLAAIELHKCVLNDEYAHLIDTDSILSTKTIVNGIAMPNTENLIRTTILAYQINSFGNYYGTVHFKYVYDCLVLNLDSNTTMLKQLSVEQYTAKFLVLGNVHFSEIEVFNNSPKMSIVRAQYGFFLKHRAMGKTVYHIKSRYQKIWARIHLIIFNTSYRKHILSNKIFRRN